MKGIFDSIVQVKLKTIYMSRNPLLETHHSPRVLLSFSWSKVEASPFQAAGWSKG